MAIAVALFFKFLIYAERNNPPIHAIVSAITTKNIMATVFSEVLCFFMVVFFLVITNVNPFFKINNVLHLYQCNCFQKILL